MMKTISNALVTLLCAQVQLDLIQAAFEWDRKNPWVQRGEGGRFGKNNTNENLEGISTFTFLTEKLKDVKNDISSVIKNNNPLSLDMDGDKSSGDDLIEKLAEEIKGEQKEDRLKTKYLKLLKEKAVPAGLTAAAFVALAALLVVTKNKKAASKMRNILSKEEVETFGIKTEELVEKVERGVVKEKPPNTSPSKSGVKPSQNPAPREESPAPRPEEKPVVVVKSENSLGLKIPDNFPSSREDLIEIKGLGGSTGAVLVMDKNTKKEFVLKKGANKEHIKEEAIADEIYRKLGIKVPQSHLYEDGDEAYKLSEYIPGVHYAKVADKDNASPIGLGYEFRKGFVVDALLGNWDVAGLGLDNLIKSAADSSLYRVDNGGSLRFRAQGGKKDFGNDVGELLSMRDSKINPSAARIFSGVDDAEVIRQIDALPTNMDDVLSHVPSDLKSTIKSRIKSLENFKKDKIAEWSKPDANLQKAINEGGFDYLHRSKSIDDSYLFIKGVKEGDSITPEEYKALGLYTGEESGIINRILRNSFPPEMLDEPDKSEVIKTLEKVNKIRNLLSKLPRHEPKQPIVRLLRGDHLIDSYKVGETYIEPGFSSCSKYSSGTGDFSDKYPNFGIKLIVKPSEKSVARDIARFNGAGEAEVLYPPGMKFEVISKTKQKFKDFYGKEFERWVVELEEKS